MDNHPSLPGETCFLSLSIIVEVDEMSKFCWTQQAVSPGFLRLKFFFIQESVLTGFFGFQRTGGHDQALTRP